MIVAVEQGKIRLYSPVPETDLGIIHSFDDAYEARTAVRMVEGQGGSVLRRAQEDLQAAEDHRRDLFSETVSIEQAETLVARLSGAIVQAKVHAGRFNAGDEVGR